jgi:glycosyltransferase involved in cell wall biosynthesis
LAQYLKAFDVFVLPSLKEGMPYVLLEAALAGLPIVTTTAVDASFVASVPGITAVEPKQAEQLARAIQNALLTNSAKPKDMEFGLAPFVEKTAALYTAD